MLKIRGIHTYFENVMYKMSNQLYKFSSDVLATYMWLLCDFHLTERFVNEYVEINKHNIKYQHKREHKNGISWQKHYATAMLKLISADQWYDTPTILNIPQTKLAGKRWARTEPVRYMRACRYLISYICLLLI